MRKAITQFLQKLNNHFTYRQRFVFFSFVFILTTPIPGYWLLKIENFFISRSQWQITGTEFSESIGELYHEVLRYRIATHDVNASSEWGETNSDLIKQSINNRFERLKKQVASTTFGELPSLGYGFTSVTAAPLNIESSTKAWKEVLQASLSGDEAALDSAQQNLMFELKRLLTEIADTFQLFLAPTYIQDQMIENAVITLPQGAALITDLLIESDTPMQTRAETLSRLVKLEELKINLRRTHSSLDSIFSNKSLSSEVSGAEFLLARQALADYQSSSSKFMKDLSKESAPSLFDNATRALDANQALTTSNIGLSRNLFKSQCSWYRVAKNTSVAIYIIVALMLSFYIIFRVLTRHLMEICYHLREMTRGNFKTCFTSHFNDEFGLIGRTFDAMSSSVQDILGELKKLSNQLTESISQITRTTKAQEDNATSQEKKLREIEDTARLIAQDSRQLAITMNELSHTSSEGSVADTAREGLDRMQGKMTDLAIASNDIITSLSSLHEKVGSAHTLIAFMGKVSDQARLLSLNSAIETASISSNKTSFQDITLKIQRFAEKTTDSTEDIRCIIDEISHSVATVRQEAHGCVKEINEGAHRLIQLSNQLTSITHQGKEQVKKFENVNDVMQMQAIAAENIIKSITHLGETAEENTRSIRSLHQSVEQLGQTAQELQKSIGLFV